jgi:hypothetical protein
VEEQIPCHRLPATSSLLAKKVVPLNIYKEEPPKSHETQWILSPYLVDRSLTFGVRFGRFLRKPIARDKGAPQHHPDDTRLLHPRPSAAGRMVVYEQSGQRLEEDMFRFPHLARSGLALKRFHYTSPVRRRSAALAKSASLQGSGWDRFRRSAMRAVLIAMRVNQVENLDLPSKVFR